MHILRPIVLGALMIAAPLAQTSRALAQTTTLTAAQADEARRLFKQGFAAFNEKRYQEAYDALSQAWKLQRSFDVAGNLGIVELELGKFRDAAEHLAFAVENLPPSAKQKEREFVTEGLAAARKEVGALSIEVDRAGAAVEVDGRAAGTSPLKSVVYVEPGTRTVVARLAGYANGTKSVTIDKASAQVVSLTLVPAAGAAATPAGTGAPPAATATDIPDVPGSRRSIVPPIVLGAIGAVGIGVGIGLAAAASGADSDAQETEDEITAANATCGGATTPGFEQRCQDYADLQSNHSTLKTGSIVSFAVGGAAAGAALVYLLWPESATPAQQGSSFRAVPTFGPRVSGVSFLGSF
jgi:hypothetical protein